MGEVNIIVETFPEMSSIIASWESNATPHDVTSAFDAIQNQLHQSLTSRFVILDFSKNNRLPLHETTSALMFNLYEHTKVLEWLVINGGHQWQIVEDVLAKATNKRRVQHFATIEFVEEYIRQNLVFAE